MSKADALNKDHTVDSLTLSKDNFYSLLAELKLQDRIYWLYTETPTSSYLTVYLEKGQLEFYLAGNIK